MKSIADQLPPETALQIHADRRKNEAACWAARDQLLDRIWGGNVYVEERTIDVHIRRLRKALEEFGYDRFVQTVRGSGYRFSARTV